MSFSGQKPEEKSASNEVNEEVKETLETIKDYSAEQWDEALKNVRIAIDYLDARIDDLEEWMERKWDRMDRAAQEKARAMFKSMRKKRNKLAE